MLGVMVGAPLKVRPDLLWGCRYPRSGALLWITSEAVGVVVDHIGNVNGSMHFVILSFCAFETKGLMVVRNFICIYNVNIKIDKSLFVLNIHKLFVFPLKLMFIWICVLIKIKTPKLY